MSRAARLVAAALALASAGVLPGPVPAAGAQAGEPTVRLASQSSWVGPGEELVLRLDIDTDRAPEEVELAVAIYRRITSRSEFQRTLTEVPRGNPITTVPPTRLAELAPDAAGAVVVRLPIQDPDQPADPARLRLAREGVYPVRVELREAGGGPTLASLTSHMVYTRPPQPGGYPLQVAMVLPVHAAPALRPDGRRQLASEPAAALHALAQSLAAYPDVALTLLPTPETLLTLSTSERATDKETVATLAASATGRQIAAGTFVPVTVSSFAAGGLATEFVTQLDRGSEVIEESLGRRPDARTWVAGEDVDERAANLLRQQQVDRLVVPEDRLEPVERTFTLAQPFEIDARAVRRPLALAADPGLLAHFDATSDPVLAAHRFLADLAVVYQDQPSRPRALVVVPPRSWRPQRAFLDSVLSGLSTATVLKGATLDDAFATVSPATTPTGAPLVRRLNPAPDPAQLPVADIVAARRRLVSFASMLTPENALDDRMEQLLLLAEGEGLRAARRRQFLDGLDARVRSQTDAVLVPGHRSITLTARDGEIPVTVLSKTGYPMRVQIRVASDKLDFPKGAVRDVDLTRRSTTERFSVRARTSGSFPLRVTLVSPDGELELGASRFTVRSTAASGVGIVLSIGAGTFLMLWWGRHLVRGRRNRRLVPG